MRTYHPIHWVETIHWHNIFKDQRFWAVLLILGFIAFLTVLVIFGAKNGSSFTMPYYGPWPYGPQMPGGPMHIP